MSSERVTLTTGSSNAVQDNTRNYGAIALGDDSSSIQTIVSPQTKIRLFLIFVPLASILLFAALVTVLLYSFRNTTVPKDVFIFKFTLMPFVSAVIVWIACYTNKSYIGALFGYLRLSSFFSARLGICENVPSIFVQVAITEVVRLATLFINRPEERLYSDYYALYTSCWVAFGWASSEVIASTLQGYSHLTLYADYPIEFDNQEDVNEPLEMIESVEVIISEEAQNNGSPVVMSQIIDEQLCDLINLKQMFDLEAAYGCPVTDVPIILSVIQRLDSIFGALGLTLILSSPFHHMQSPTDPTPATSRSILILYIVVVLIHTLLSSLWCPRILPNIGIHTSSFIACFISIGCVFAGLWRWGILV